MKILIVDDEETIRELIQMIIHDHYPMSEFVLAESGNQAKEVMKAHTDIDLIICDYNMPNGNGEDLFQYNSQHKNIPFFLCTGGFSGMHQGVDNFHQINPQNQIIDKPIDENHLLKCIASLH